MKIVIAADKYKGSLSALKVCQTIEKAALKLDPELQIIVSPMADGGDGTVKTLVESLHGKLVEAEVRGPVGLPVSADFGIVSGDTAIIEMASASGLVLVPPRQKKSDGDNDLWYRGTYKKGSGCRIQEDNNRNRRQCHN